VENIFKRSNQFSKSDAKNRLDNVSPANVVFNHFNCLKGIMRYKAHYNRRSKDTDVTGCIVEHF
jgi:hypothetical protein